LNLKIEGKRGKAETTPPYYIYIYIYIILFWKFGDLFCGFAPMGSHGAEGVGARNVKLSGKAEKSAEDE